MLDEKQLRMILNCVMSFLIKYRILICLLIGKHPFTCFNTKELNKTERTQDARKNVLVISDVKRQNCFS